MPSGTNKAVMWALAILLATVRVLVRCVMQLLEDVQEESGKYGVVEGIAVPKPPAGISPSVGNRVFIVFATAEQAKKAKDVFHGRQFDGNNITAKFVAEEDFERASAGEWAMMDLPDQEPGAPAMPPPPGWYNSMLLHVLTDLYL